MTSSKISGSRGAAALERAADETVAAFARVREADVEEAITFVSTRMRENHAFANGLRNFVNKPTNIALIDGTLGSGALEPGKKGKGKGKGKVRVKKLRAQWTRFKQLESIDAAELNDMCLAACEPRLFGAAVVWPEQPPNKAGMLRFMIGAKMTDLLCVKEYPETVSYENFVRAVVHVYRREGNRASTFTLEDPPVMWFLDKDDPLTIHCFNQKIEAPNLKREGIKVEWAAKLDILDPFEPNVRVTITMADGMKVILPDIQAAFIQKGVEFKPFSWNLPLEQFVKVDDDSDPDPPQPYSIRYGSLTCYPSARLQTI